MTGDDRAAPWSGLRLGYVARSRVPSDLANSLQVMKMCGAFATHVRTVDLLIPFRWDDWRAARTDDASAWERYALTRRFRIARVLYPHWRDRFEVRGFSLAATARAAARRYDLVYSRDVWTAYWLGRMGRPVAFEAHNLAEEQRYPVWRAMLSSHALRGIFCISGALADAYAGAGAPRERLYVLPDGVDLERFAAPLTLHEARQRLGLPMDAAIICHSGHLYPGRGGEETIEALVGLPRALLVMVGGRAEDIARLRAKGNGLGLGERLLFVGQVPNNEVPAYLWAADVLVMPYTSRTPTVRYMSPLKMFEYMAAGRPIVATDFPVVREVLRDGHTSLLVAPDSGEALRKGLQRLLSDPSLQQRLADAAREAAKAYSWEQRAARILAAIRLDHWVKGRPGE
jgi:glycosyltransferase involved in cell wall biosynthesis